MNRLLAFLLAIVCQGAVAESSKQIITLEDAAAHLARVSEQTIRPYSTRDFGREKYSEGRSVVVPEENAEEVLANVRKVLPPGLVGYIGTTNSLATPPAKGSEIVVAKGATQFDILRIAASDAVNYDMSTDDLVAKLKQWDSAFGIDIWQAETDTIQFRFTELPKDIRAFAKEVYEFCPDIVDQGVGSVEELEKEIRTKRSLLLWWD